MRGVLLTGHGDLDMLEVRDDIPVPKPTSREVLIQVAAAGVNNTDVNTRTGWYSKGDEMAKGGSWAGAPIHFPRIQGADVCGHIVAVGDDVTPRRIGERVLIEPCIWEADGKDLKRPWYFGSECDGGFAEYTAVAARHAFPIDSQLDDTDLASFPCSYSTAENLLTRASVAKGDEVLVTGASGGVGSAVVQLATSRGARVFAVTSKSKSEQVKRLGADRTFTRESRLDEILGRDSVDVVIDLVAGPIWRQLLDVTRPGGRYAVAGAIGGPLVELDVRTLYLKDLSLFGCTVLDPNVFPNLIRRIEQDDLYPLVAAVYPLERIAEAQTAFVKKNHIGKIVLSCTL